MDQIASEVADFLGRLKWVVVTVVAAAIVVVIVVTIVLVQNTRAEQAAAAALEAVGDLPVAKREAALEAVVKNYPDTWGGRTAAYELGAYAYSAGNEEKAARWLREVVKTAPSEQDLIALQARLLLTYVLEMQGKLDEALREARDLSASAAYPGVKGSANIRAAVLGQLIRLKREVPAETPSADGTASAAGKGSPKGDEKAVPGSDGKAAPKDEEPSPAGGPAGG